MIDVDAELRAESTGLRVRIDGKGSELTCRLEGDGRDLFLALYRSRRLLPAIRALVPVLVRTGLHVEVLAGNVRIGRAGRGVRQNALARLLKIPSAQLGT